MPCDPEELRHVPLFELLDDDEAQVLAAQVEIKRFAQRQRIFKAKSVELLTGDVDINLDRLGFSREHLGKIERRRRNWPFLRDRRIDAYGDLTRLFRS